MIELHDLHKNFAGVRAVDGVSLSINRGEFITLLGPSGCGKTTLLRMISGFETPDAGHVIIDGTDVTHRPPYRRDVNQVFQSYALFPHLSVKDNIAFGLKMKKLPRNEIHREVAGAMEMVELKGLETRKPNQLSGGQKQRVALARAIVRHPKVLLLDEPLAALDAKLRQSMQLELKRLQQKLGITFVFVTHDQSEALVLSDRIAVMNQGRIEQLGPPTQVYRHPRTLFVGQFLGQANIWQAEVIGLNRVRIGEIELEINNLPVGANRVTLLVRPEKIIIGATQGFETEVIEEHFTGAVSHLRLITPAGIELQAMLPHGTGIEIRKGQRVICAINSADVSVI